MQVCPRCGEENPDRFRLCGSCGLELRHSTPSQEIRKTVTVVFCDLKGSTALAERVDLEALRQILNRYFEAMRRAVERHGGTVEKYIGDAVMAVFGLPRLHEDDALRAVRAAADMRLALQALNEELEGDYGIRLANRTGVNTGEVVAGDVSTAQRLVTGDAVNVAARLEQSAGEMEVVIGASTYRLVRDAVRVEPLGAVPLKGKAEPVPAFRLLSVGGADGVARRHDAPMVGRGAELRVLADAFGRTVDESACHLVVVLGQAGVGKSRLVAEFLAQIGDGATALRGRCLPYGEGITFWPLTEIVRQAAGISDEDGPDRARSRLDALLSEEEAGGTDLVGVADGVASALGLSDSSHGIEETFWAFRKLFEVLARRRPTIVIFDDIHWAEATLLDLIDTVAGTGSGHPLLLICLARPELLEDPPAWLRTRANVSVTDLLPLSTDQTSQIAENLLGSTRLPAEVHARIGAAAGGNPLFVEQLLSMLIDEELLRSDEEGGWILAGPTTSLSVPPTLAALLAARLDRLPADERDMIQRASVIGDVFYRGAVEALLPGEGGDGVSRGLASLTQKQFIRPDQSTFAGEEAFSFVHVLIRDSAYTGLLKKSRADLHERFATWLESAAGSRVMEYEEILGYHLEQAYRYRLQLGLADGRAQDIGAGAARRLGSAGSRALARGDSSAAANLLGRATAMLPDRDARRLELLPDLGEALVELGDLARAEASLGMAIGESLEAGDVHLAARAQVVLLFIRFLTNAAGWGEQVLREVERIIPVFEEADDHRGLSKAWALMGYIHGTACRFGAAEEAVGRALEHARLAGDRREEARNLTAYAQSAVYGPTSVPDAIARCQSLLKEAEGDHRAEALIMCALSRLHALAGQFEPARELYRRSRAVSEEFGGRLQSALTSIDSGPVEMLAGDLVAAEIELRRDFQVLEEMGEKAYLSTTAAWLAHVMVGQDRHDEAERFAQISEESAAPNDVETQVLWRCARARSLAHQGHTGEAERIVRHALSLIEQTEQPDAQGMVLMDLARVLIAAERSAEAVPVIERAVGLFVSKGNVVSEAKAHGLLDETQA